LISIQRKERQSDEDKQFSQLLNRELADGFPNPDRDGCPAPGFLQRVARHQVPISEIEPWIDHLGSCSECFKEVNRLKTAFSARRRRVISYAATACIVLASVGFLWRYLGRLPEMRTPDADTAATNAERQDAASAADRRPFEVMLNLTRSATRGERSTNDRDMIRVPARPLACRITLPFGSSDGLYFVRVQRTVQSEVLRTSQGNATINAGDVRLDIDLDLSNMAEGRYLLSYRRTGKSWHPIPIVITNLTKQ